MAKREKCTQLNSKQIIAFCVKTYGEEHAITKATIATQSTCADKKSVKRVVAVKKTTKAKAANVANNILCINSFVKKAHVRKKSNFDAANINVVNHLRVVLGLNTFTKKQYASWFLRNQLFSKAISIAA